jgi:hypothetical protein
MDQFLAATFCTKILTTSNPQFAASDLRRGLCFNGVYQEPDGSGNGQSARSHLFE